VHTYMCTKCTHICVYIYTRICLCTCICIFSPTYFYCTWVYVGVRVLCVCVFVSWCVVCLHVCVFDFVCVCLCLCVYSVYICVLYLCWHRRRKQDADSRNARERTYCARQAAPNRCSTFVFFAYSYIDVLISILYLSVKGIYL